MNEMKMNDAERSEGRSLFERAKDQVEVVLRKTVSAKNDEIVTTKSGISYNLTVTLESKELAEKAIRGLISSMDLQEEGFIERLKELSEEAQRRNKKMKEYEALKTHAVTECCNEKTLRFRAEKLLEARTSRNEELLTKLTEKKIKIQELERINRKVGDENLVLRNEKEVLQKDRDFWRSKYAEYDSEQLNKSAPSEEFTPLIG